MGIAAIATLPHAKPTTAELKMIAVRTWLEPSKEVASFIYSTLKSLSLTEDPELKTVGLQVHGLMALVKPVVFNPLYAQNLHFTKLVNYCKWLFIKKSPGLKVLRVLFLLDGPKMLCCLLKAGAAKVQLTPFTLVEWTNGLI